MLKYGNINLGDNMKVSVIIPAYNAENYLARSLDSIVNQVYKNLEIIIIDDKSEDNTKQIIKEYAEKDDRIIPFYSTLNKGVSAARNIGLKAATGDYIMFVDSDDELTKDAIRRMIDVANKYNSDYVDSYHLLYYRKTNNKQVSFTEHKVPKNVLVLGSLKENNKVLDMYTYVTGKLIKKDLIKDLQFDENLSRYEDLVLEHELKTRIKNYVFLNKVTYFYYQREDSLVNTFGKKHLCFLDAAKKVREIYNEYDNDIKDKVDSMLFQNMILTLFTKVIKNDDTLDENVKTVNDCLNDLVNTFNNYRNNKYINGLIKKFIEKYINNEDKLKKLIKKLQKKNLIRVYFNYLSVVNKYELKNPLL